MIYNLALHFCKGFGCVNKRLLIEKFGSAEELFKTKKNELLSIGLKNEQADSILNSENMFRAEKEINFMLKNNIQALSYQDSAYPKRLKECKDAPWILFVKGKVDFENEKVLSVVGTRRADAYGIKQTQKIIEELSAKKVLIISGLAYGIDTQAHKSALDNQLPGICVLGHGLDRIYPESNQKLAEELLVSGAWVSERASGTPIQAKLFPRRNRIIAGLSDAVLVVQSSFKGGSIITAKLASSYHRDVFAIPGRNDDYYASGCNMLIKNQEAALIQNAQDIEQAMNWDFFYPISKKKREKEEENKAGKFRIPDNLDENEKKILLALERENLHIDDLLEHANLRFSDMIMLLLQMETKGLLHSLPGSRYALGR